MIVPPNPESFVWQQNKFKSLTAQTSREEFKPEWRKTFSCPQNNYSNNNSITETFVGEINHFLGRKKFFILKPDERIIFSQ